LNNQKPSIPPPFHSKNRLFRISKRSLSLGVTFTREGK
jgi:hypothetical protein